MFNRRGLEERRQADRREGPRRRDEVDDFNELQDMFGSAGAGCLAIAIVCVAFLVVVVGAYLWTA